jgi:hypothetical protein
MTISQEGLHSMELDAESQCIMSLFPIYNIYKLPIYYIKTCT